MEETFGPHGTTTAPGCAALGTCAAAVRRTRDALVKCPIVKAVSPEQSQLVALDEKHLLLIEDHWTHRSLALCPLPPRLPWTQEQVPSASLVMPAQLAAKLPEHQQNLQGQLAHHCSKLQRLVPESSLEFLAQVVEGAKTSGSQQAFPLFPTCLHDSSWGIQNLRELQLFAHLLFGVLQTTLTPFLTFVGLLLFLFVPAPVPLLKLFDVETS